MPDPTEPVPVRALVTATHPVMLAGGHPAAPGEEVTADLHQDAGHLETGAIVRLPDDLDHLTRAQLNERATEVGVEDPHLLPNKAEVVAAIHAATTPED